MTEDNMEFIVTVPSYVLWSLIVIGSIIAWSIIAAIVAGLLTRFGYEQYDDLPPAQLLGAIFPFTIFCLLIALVCIISYQTILLPARWIYKITSGEE